MRQSLAIIVFLSLLLTGCSGAPPADAPAADAQVQAAAPTSTAPAAPAAAPAVPPTVSPTAERVSIALPTPTPVPTPTSAPPSCAEQAGDFTGQATELLREWDDAVLLADSTPRISLAEQIEKLQALRRRAEDLEAPECVVQIKAQMIGGMNSAVSGFIDFMGDPESLGAGSIRLSKYETDAAQHALAALTDYPGSWEPFTVEDVKALFPQYAWEDRTNRDGETYLWANAAPLEMQVSHDSGVVYSIYIGVSLYDDDAPDYAAAWQDIQAAALMFLPAWTEAEAWLTAFGAAPPTDSLQPVVTHADVTTIRTAHVRYDGFGLESASVSITIPHKGAAGK